LYFVDTRRNLVKKIIYSLLALIMLASPALATGKAKLKLGPVKIKAKEGVVAASQGAFINITMGGSGKKGSGSLTILVPSDFAPEKGESFGLFSLVGEEDDDNPGELALGFSATSIKRKGLSIATSVFAEAAETVTTGTVKVKSYNPETKVLKFNIKAAASPYTLNKGNGNETVSKKFRIKGQVVVTLP
jgi:hypothetical protein